MARGVGRWVAVILVIAATALGIARLAAWTANYEVSFDGAMNLEVARSLAEGNGYRRLYADRSGFSHEIQSRAPYILPAAAIIKAFGVGVWQAQLANFLYVIALLVVVFVLVQRRGVVAMGARCGRGLLVDAGSSRDRDERLWRGARARVVARVARRAGPAR